MNPTKEVRKALRAKLSQAIASVLTQTPGVDSEKAAKAIKKGIRKLVRKVTQPAAITLATPANASAGPSSPAKQADQEKLKKNKAKKDKAEKSAQPKTHSQ